MQLVFLHLLLVVSIPVCAQSIQEFTPAEQQSISVPTPGLFDRSDAFEIDFTDVAKGSYSFPLPVGKAELVNNNSELEITTTKGDAVKAMFGGVVRLSKNNPPFGNVIVIRHDNGLETVYGYNAQNLVKVGDRVKAGQTIAIVGGEGLRTFCNFAIMVSGRRINPAIIIEVHGHKLHPQTLTFRKTGKRIEVKTHRVRDNMTDFKADPFAKSSTIKWNLADMKKSQWSYPLPGAHVISPYGQNRGTHIHSGVDIKTKANDNVRAAFDGEVIQSGPNGAYGNCIKIQHGNGLVTLYAHQSKNFVKAGQKVKAGQIIGLAGRTGRATTEHVHFEIFFCNRRYNPNILFNHERNQLQNATLTISKSGKVTSKKN
ncbi:MAG: M23 family metallopeptidase [Prevotella sp.]|nr:M23 family metallopeptidase [Prevotella sp.]